MTEPSDISKSFESIAIDSSQKRALKKWGLVKNVMKASKLFNNQEVEVVDDVEHLVDDLQRLTTKTPWRKSISITSSAINNHKATELLFHYIQRSNAEDIEAIKDLIDNHPLKYVRNCTDANSFINKQDIHGKRPIYEAARNGYAETVQLLIENGADPKLDCNGENCLQAACRWNHLVVIKCLINATSWSYKEIKSAMKETSNGQILNFLKSKMPKSGFWCTCKGR